GPASRGVRHRVEVRPRPLGTAAGGVPATLGAVGPVEVAPAVRRGLAAVDGDGDVAGGVVILGSGGGARGAVVAVPAKLADLYKSLPAGVARVAAAAAADRVSIRSRRFIWASSVAEAGIGARRRTGDYLSGKALESSWIAKPGELSQPRARGIG
ncbi:hypothetical protein DAH70_17030, partial [Sphingomonas koreensis]|uniref:hypothetical protein n=1 Tax=Sphingomonas koreensis TaxID=93064 RepID=UPI0010034976